MSDAPKKQLADTIADAALAFGTSRGVRYFRTLSDVQPCYSWTPSIPEIAALAQVWLAAYAAAAGKEGATPDNLLWMANMTEGYSND